MVDTNEHLANQVLDIFDEWSYVLTPLFRETSSPYEEQKPDEPELSL